MRRRISHPFLGSPASRQRSIAKRIINIQNSRILVGSTANEHVTRYRVLKRVLCYCTSLNTHRIKGAQKPNFRVNITAQLSICNPSLKTPPFGEKKAVAAIK